jgi:hypothetical protein
MSISSGTTDRHERIVAVENPPRRFRRQPIGIDPDFRIRYSHRLLDLYNGPFLEQGLKAIAGRLIGLSRRTEDHPNRNLLALRLSNSAAPMALQFRQR